MVRTALTGLLASGLFGQSFEVASIKQHDGPTPRIGVTTSGQRLTADAANIAVLVMYAYNLKSFQVTGTSPLFQDYNTRWDIVAKAEGGNTPTTAEFRQMLQWLLAERFQLEAHREMREIPVYALVVGKNGPKFKESNPDADAMGLFSAKGRNMVITLPKASMSDAVDAVGNAFLERPVVDKTGLTGTYNIRLTYTPNTRANRESDPDLNDINVFQAVEEQLGLKLEARKEMVEMLIVDRVEKPSAN
jgi:uncharacterized protein (TIGR03435 family)